MFNNNMYKKLAVAGFVIVTFIIYSLHQRNEDSQAAQKVSTSQNNTLQNAISSTNTTAVPTASSASYKDGSYTGKSSDAFYGYIQVRATITGGKLSDITILDYPQDRDNSVEINNAALPQLKQEAIQAQSSQVDGISGATDTSQAFEESLADALTQAKA